MLATEGRHIETARILIKGGADVSAVNERIESMTALHISTRNNDIAITKLLVDAGAKVGAVAARCTPLQVASDLGNLEVMEILIKAGANVDHRRATDGITAIYLSAKSGQLAAVRLLLLSNANPLIPTDTGVTPLCAAAGHGYVGIVLELVEGAGVKEFGNSLVFAAHNGHLEVMKMLYAAGARDKNGEGLRSAVMYGGGEAVVKFLLQRPEPLLPCWPSSPYTSAESRYVNYKPSSNVNNIPPLLCCLGVPRTYSHRVLRMLIDAGANTEFPISIVGDNDRILSETSPLGMTTRVIQLKKFNGRRFADESIPWVERMHRLLLQVGAVRAVSWGWAINDASTSAEVASARPALPAPVRRYKAAKKTRVVMRALRR